MALNFANNNSLSSITALPTSISGGGLNLISTSTITSATDGIEITSGLDSTYKEYIFKFYNLYPVADGASWQFQASTDGGSSYGVNKVSTFFEAEHDEGDSSTALQYNTGFDRGANSTDYITLISEIGDDADQSGTGTLHLFDPSNTTFAKHYIANTSQSSNGDYSRNQFIGGYFNTTSAINALRFEMRTNTIQTGVMKMYGVS
jgi:hypothetical protein